MKARIVHINDDLLIRYLAEETTEVEKTAVEGWLAKSEANQKRLEAYRAIFEETKFLKAGEFGNADKAWAQFKQKIDWQTETLTPIYPFKKWMAVAASIILLLSVGLGLYLRQPASINFYAKDKPLVDSLPDGSMVSLTSNSSLKFKVGNVRKAILTGAAFFEVKHDDNHPFQVQVNDMTINVLGTSFSIKNEGGRTEIKVLTGVVAVSGENQIVKLQAGEKLEALKGRQWQKQGLGNFNTNDYPGLLQLILKDPGKSKSILKSYTPKTDTSATAKNKTLVRTIIQQMVDEGLVKAGSVQAFRLDGKGFIVNGVLEPDTVFRRYKAKYLPSNDFMIVFGNEPFKGKGIFVPRNTF